jgi:hypothetical protein
MLNDHEKAVENQWARKRDEEALANLAKSLDDKKKEEKKKDDKKDEKRFSASPLRAPSYDSKPKKDDSAPAPTFEDLTELRQELIGKIRDLEDEISLLRNKIARK